MSEPVLNQQPRRDQDAHPVSQSAEDYGDEDNFQEANQEVAQEIEQPIHLDRNPTKGTARQEAEEGEIIMEKTQIWKVNKQGSVRRHCKQREISRKATVHRNLHEQCWEKRRK
jgi:hypothetical protein